MNCQFDIYFPPACDVIWSLSEINLIDTNSIRFRVVTNARAISKVLVVLEKDCSQMGIVVSNLIVSYVELLSCP